MSEWISIQDKLPEVGKRIVVTNRLTGSLTLARYVTVGGSHNPHEVFENFQCEQLFDVTDWLGLPETPKDKL